MRILLVWVAVSACTDAAVIPTTIARVHVSATCTEAECGVYPDVYQAHCGPSSEQLVTPKSTSVTITTSYDADVLAGYVQAQYTSDRVPERSPELAHYEQALTELDKFDVYPTYYVLDDEYKPLYRITPDGSVIDIDMTKLVAATGNQLQFAYDAYQVSVVEDHAIDAPRMLRIETDDPGLSEMCCSVGGARDLGLVLFALVLGLRRRRTTSA